MVKYFSIFCFALFSVCISAQNNLNPVLKVFLEDAKTKNNIKDAKVTLEGFEIPAIIAKYDKKNKYYYFTEIPSGYNTVMAYHKKYNEKGFQNTTELPAELKFQLYDPLNVSYDFESSPFKNSYVEDPYKISISSENHREYNSLRELINKTIRDSKLQIELVNPYLQISKIDKDMYHVSQKEDYPVLNFKENDEVRGDYLFPLKGGVSTFFPDRSYSNGPNDICFILRKSDGSKFKRWNDPVIKKLKDLNFEISSIILNKKNYADYNNEFRIRDLQNKKFNLKNKIDSSKVFFYDNNFRNQPKPSRLFNFLKTTHYLAFEEPGNRPQLPCFVLISNKTEEIYNLFPEIGKENPELFKIPTPDPSVGLGILDLYDYYSKLNKEEKKQTE